MLGARAAAGRLLRPEDDVLGAAPVVVASGNFWQRQLRWLPISAKLLLGTTRAQLEDRRAMAGCVTGRLKPGVSLADAQAELESWRRGGGPTIPSAPATRGSRSPPGARMRRRSTPRPEPWSA
jgi:hypothetical protein